MYLTIIKGEEISLQYFNIFSLTFDKFPPISHTNREEMKICEI